jgi:tetratricopeptide (TPR) repeat protein
MDDLRAREARAIALQRAGDVAGAEAGYRELLAAGHETAPTLTNLAAIVRRREGFDEAEALLRRAIAIAPELGGPYLNLGNVLHQVGRLEAAEAAYRTALAANLDNPQEARMGLARVLLSLGHNAEGWRAMDARPDRERAITRGLTGPEWRGEDLTGKRLLIWPEQGFGDHIIMLRYVPRVAGKAVMVIMPQLMRVAGGLGVDLIAHAERIAAPAFDYWTLPFSLPIWLAAGDDDLATTPYLGGADRGVRGVGVVWQGNARPDPGRSLPADLAAELLALPGAVSLAPEDTGATDFQDTADLIAGLDLVVSIDTSVAHLAGAMGKPTWVLRQARPPEWRWRADAEGRSVWYPSARVISQPSPGDWRSVVDRVKADWPISG